MDKRKLAKIKSVEDEFCQPFDDVIDEFAKDYSFSFTVSMLGLNKDTFSFLKPRFANRKMQPQERPHVSKRNIECAARYNGMTVSQIAEQTRLSKSAVHRRIKLGQDLLAPKKSPSIRNLGTNRNNATWKDKISRECEIAKSYPSASAKSDILGL